MTQVLALASESDTEIEVNYKEMSLRFNVSGLEYKLTAEGISEID